MDALRYLYQKSHVRHMVWHGPIRENLILETIAYWALGVLMLGVLFSGLVVWVTGVSPAYRARGDSQENVERPERDEIEHC